MMKLKKVVSLALVAAMVFTSVPMSFAKKNGSISDVDNRANTLYEYSANGEEVGITASLNSHNNHTGYQLKNDYYGAFEIDQHTGVVTVKDNTKLINPTSSLVEIPVEYDLLHDAHTYYSNSTYSSQDGNVSIVMTEPEKSQKAGMFSKSRINLNNAFEYNFTLYLGSRTKGADGIVFFLNAEEPTLGWHGGSLGYGAGGDNINQGMKHSFGVEFDTWNNGSTVLDSNGNHIAFVANGSSKHLESYNPNYNLEDGRWKNVKIKWDPDSDKFKVYVNNSKVLEYTGDIISQKLNGQSDVFFGFTAATGAEYNDQLIYNPYMKTVPEPYIVVKASNITQRFDIDIKSGGKPFTLNDDTATTMEDAAGTIVMSAMNGSVIEFDPTANQARVMFNYGNGWFDITTLNDVMYGVLSRKLYKNIDGVKQPIGELSNRNINSLEDVYGKIFYMDGQYLKYYNPATNGISNYMYVGYSSAGDLLHFNGKMYLATTNSKLVEIDMDEKDVKVVYDRLPYSRVYGLAEHNGQMYLGHDSIVSRLENNNGTWSFEKHYDMGNYGIDIDYIYGATEGKAYSTGNVLSNDTQGVDLRVKSVNGIDISSMIPRDEEVVINGHYGVLFVQPNGEYRYAVDNSLKVIQDLKDGQFLNEDFNFVIGYPSTSASDKSSRLRIRINGNSNDPVNTDIKGLHLDALDIDGNGSNDEVYNSSKVSTWNDSAGDANNKATSSTPYPAYNKNAFGSMAGVDFKDTTKSMHIASHDEINSKPNKDDVFKEKSFAFVIKTGDDVSGDQFIYEQGGPVRGYNLSIAPDPNNNDQPTLWAMVYNNKSDEWTSGDYYKPIKLGVAQPNKVYTIFMTHEAYNSNVFKAYINGDLSTVTDAGVVEGAIHQFGHPNPIGVGGVNDETIHPVTNVVVKEGPNTAYKGIIGEIITWNSLLEFEDVTKINEKLNEKWKTPEAATVLDTKQVDETLEITWPVLSGATEYEIYISSDTNIDSGDKKISTSNNKVDYTLLAPYKNLEDVYVILRYKKDNKWSEALVKQTSLLKQPKNFIYYEENQNYVFTFDREEGKAYAFTTDDENFTYLEVGNRVELPATTIDASSIKVYEVAFGNNGADFNAGRGIPATPPTLIEVPKVKNLVGTFVNGSVSLSWDPIENGGSVDYYKVYMGSSLNNLTEVKSNITANNTKIDLSIINTTTKYFKVVGKMADGSVFEFSQPSDVTEVLCQPTDFNPVQKGDKFQYDWNEIIGASDYEIYISTDDAIDSNDTKYTYQSGSTSLEDIPQAYLDDDKVKLIFRLKKDGVWSDPIVRERKILKAPTRFKYTPNGNTIDLSFTREIGKAYVLKIEGLEDLIITDLSKITIPMTDKILTAEVFEVSYDNGVASYTNGHSATSGPPALSVASAVLNLKLNDAETNIIWDAYPGAVSYDVYRGESAASATTGTPFASGITTTSFDVSNPDNTYYYSVRAILEDTPFISNFAKAVMVEYTKADYIEKPSGVVGNVSLSGILVGDTSPGNDVVPVNVGAVTAKYSEDFKAISSYKITTDGVFNPVVEYEIKDMALYGVTRPAPRIEKVSIVNGEVVVTAIADYDYKISRSESEGITRVYIYNFLDDDSNSAPVNTIYRAKISTEIVVKKQDNTFTKEEKSAALQEVLDKINEVAGFEISPWKLGYYAADAMGDESIQFQVRFKWNESNISNDSPQTREKAGAFKETTIKLENQKELPEHINGNN